MKLSHFTALGLDRFSSFLDELENNPFATLPAGTLDSPASLQVLDEDSEILPRHFRSRWDAAKYLSAMFADAGPLDIENDVHLWALLSAFYFDTVCPLLPGVGRRIRERAAYIPEPGNYRRYYRHLLLGPYLLYRAHQPKPEIALSMLCRPVHIISDIEAQIAARQELVSNPSVVQLATELYYDPASGTTKPGAGGKAAGSPRRFVAILDQFDLTRDLYAATADELRRLLPREFERFLH